MQWCLSPYPYITLRVSFTFNILPLSILKMNMTLPFVVNPTLSHLSLSYFLPAGMKGNGMFSLTHRHTIFGIPAQHWCGHRREYDRVFYCSRVEQTAVLGLHVRDDFSLTHNRSISEEVQVVAGFANIL